MNDSAHIGILSAGTVGRQVARYLLDAGRLILISNSRGLETLKSTAAELGAGAQPTTAQQAAQCDIVILAVPSPRVGDTLGALSFEG
jgi:predicted dinucleotide-binding enzyme